MNRIKELLNRLKPEAIEYKNVSEIAVIKKGIQFNKENMFDIGTYPVINGGINPSGFIEQYNFDENSITISQGGASAGYVNWIKTKFWAGAHCYVVQENGINKRYLYHFLKQNEKKLQECQYGAGIPALSKKTIEDLEIPVPPLEVQREIVRILDSFTFLSAELSAELQARKKQYEYYRDNMLLFNEKYESMLLKDVVKHSCSGSTPQKSNPDYYENGTIPWIRTQDVCFNEITSVDSFITDKALEETSVKWIPENCVIVAISGATAGRCAINKIKATTNQHCLNLEIDKNKALYKYVYYCLCSKQNDLISRKQGPRGDLNSSLVLSLEIPIPNLDIQEKIVNVLDNFESICNDLNIGLPAEIEARQKQYEYYRDMLLTFAETGDIMPQTDRQTDKQ